MSQRAPDGRGGSRLAWTSPNGGARLLWHGPPGRRQLAGLLEPAKELNRGGQWDLVLTGELRTQGDRMSPAEAMEWAMLAWAEAHPVGPLVVLLDCDGPVSEYVKEALAFLRTSFVALTDWTPDPDVWDLRAGLPEGGLASRYARALDEESKSQHFCAGLDVVEGAAEGIAELLARPRLVDLHVVTTSWPGSPWWAGEREAWLDRMVGLPANRVTFTAQKWLLAGDVLIDDKYETLVAWKARHPRGVAILWRAAWNRPYWRTCEECRTCGRLTQAHFTDDPCVYSPGHRDPSILAVDGWRGPDGLLALLLSLAENR